MLQTRPATPTRPLGPTALAGLAVAFALLLAAVMAHPASAAPAPGSAGERTGPRCGTAADLGPNRSARSLARARRSVLCLLNVERGARGLHRLRTEHRLRTAARRHSVHMVTRRFFDHTSPTGSTMVTRIAGAGYRRHLALGENIAWGDGQLATPRAIVAAWMHSPGHRANILNPRFREIGIGVALGTPRGAGPARATYTTDFGCRA